MQITGPPLLTVIAIPGRTVRSIVSLITPQRTKKQTTISSFKYPGERERQSLSQGKSSQGSMSDG